MKIQLLTNLPIGLVRLSLVLGVFWIVILGWTSRELFNVPLQEEAKKECKFADYHRMKRAGFTDEEMKSFSASYIKKMGSAEQECLKSIKEDERINEEAKKLALYRIFLPPIFFPILITGLFLIFRWVTEGFSRRGNL